MEELRQKLPATFLDRGKVLDFSEEILKGIAKGKKNYPETYTFDPLEEAMQECVDGVVYLMITYYRIQRLKEKLDGLASKES